MSQLSGLRFILWRIRFERRYKILRFYLARSRVLRNFYFPGVTFGRKLPGIFDLLPFFFDYACRLVGSIVGGMLDCMGDEVIRVYIYALRVFKCQLDRRSLSLCEEPVYSFIVESRVRIIHPYVKCGNTKLFCL